MPFVEKTPHQQRVEQFMRDVCQQDVPTIIAAPSKETAELRARLILEEALETIEALGVTVTICNDAGAVLPLSPETQLAFQADLAVDLNGVADGCADISVVTIGTLSSCGIPDVALLGLVDQNNLDKAGPGSYRDEGGKLIKPPDHKPPDIGSLLSLIRAAQLRGWK